MVHCSRKEEAENIVVKFAKAFFLVDWTKVLA